MLRIVSRILKRSDNSPVSGFIRLCRKRSEFLYIVNEAKRFSGGTWEEDLIDRVGEYILGGKLDGISVYSVQTLSPFDIGHALGVIAEGISQSSFRSSYGKRTRACTRGTLLIPLEIVSETIQLKHTPSNNLNFSPADIFHYDVKIDDVRGFSVSILEAIRSERIKAMLLGDKGVLKGSYACQARLAYSYCLQRYGFLDPRRPPRRWGDGKDLDACEQIDTIEYLVDLDSCLCLEGF